jgi:hypothetical protein
MKVEAGVRLRLLIYVEDGSAEPFNELGLQALFGRNKGEM